MASYNKVILLGNLTRDPETRYTPQGTAVSGFGLGVNRRFKDKEGKLQEETTFVDIEAWGQTAENCGKYLKKGDGVLVDGRLKQDKWEKDGQSRTKMKVVAGVVQFMPKRGRGKDGAEETVATGDPGTEEPRPEGRDHEEPARDDGVPF